MVLNVDSITDFSLETDDVMRASIKRLSSSAMIGNDAFL